MCLKCFISMDNTILYQHINTINQNSFENTTLDDINNFIILGSGFNGNLIRQKVLQIVQNYLHWLEFNNSNKPILDITILKQKFQYVKNNTVDVKNCQQLLDYLIHI